MTPRGTIVVVLAILLAGCANLEDDWQKAKKDDKAQAYEQFLRKHPNSPHETEAQKALSEIVLIPYFAFVGDSTAMPPLEKLKVPDAAMAASLDKTLNDTSVKMNGSIPWLLINGKVVRLTSPQYDGNTVDTIEFGRLRCTFAAQGNITKGASMVFYLGGTRAQRDALLAYVLGSGG